MSLIDVRGLSCGYGGRDVLSGIDLAIEPGEIVTIVGPNGSGKSTLLRALIGAVRATRGTVRRAPGLRIGYVPQAMSIDARMPITVERFLALPHRRLSRERIDTVLDRAGVPTIAGQAFHALSGGQRQRVLLARAMLDEPQLILLDEPTAGLDQPAQAAFYQQLAELRDESGAAIVMVSHDLHVVMSASDRVICVNGHICCEGAPDTVSSAPAYRALFGLGTAGALALYRHEHDHAHDDCAHDHAHGPEAAE